MSSLTFIAYPSDAPSPKMSAQIRRLGAATPFRGKTLSHRIDRRVLAIQHLAGETSLCRQGGRLIAVDGYIANWRDIDPSIQGKSDAERLGRFLSRVPTESLAQLDGEFSTIICAADGVTSVYTSIDGIRALHYRHGHANLVIATDIRQLHLLNDETPSIDHGALVEYLLFNQTLSQPGKTYYQGISRILPGRLYRFSPGKKQAVVQPLWQPPDTETVVPSQRNQAERAAELRMLLDHAVEHAIPDENTGLSLSGGLDSGSLWGTIRHLAARGDQRAASTSAFSQIFPGQTCDESRIIHLHEGFHGVTVKKLDVSTFRNTDFIQALTERLDYIVAPNAYYYEPFYRFVHEQGRGTLLLGIGGDEWFEPSQFHLGDAWSSGRRIEALMAAWKGNQWTRRRNPGANLRRAFKLTLAREGSWPRRLYNQLRRPPAWLHPAWHELYRDMLALKEQSCLENGVRRSRLLSALNWFATYGMAPNQQFAAGHQLDIRHPLMHRSLIEFGFRTPPDLLVYPDNEPKALLRRAMRNRLPEAVLSYPSKPNFNIPGVNDTGLLGMVPAARYWLLSEIGIVNPSWLTTQLTRPLGSQLPAELSNLVTTEIFLEALRGESG